MKLELFFILFPVDYLKEVLIPKTNNILKHQMEIGIFIQWIGCWVYIGFWVIISNRRNWWSTADPNMSDGSPFRINNYMSRMRFEAILLSLYRMFNIMMGSYTCVKWKRHGT